MRTRSGCLTGSLIASESNDADTEQMIAIVFLRLWNDNNMKITNNIWINLIVILQISCSQYSQHKDDDVNAQVIAGLPIPNGVMDPLLEMYHVPGISIAIIHNGHIDWAKGYGVRKYGNAGEVDSLTLFQAASISKPVSAAIAL